MLRKSAASVGQGKREPHWRHSKKTTGGTFGPSFLIGRHGAPMLRNISFLNFRNANGCGARYTPLETLLVHPSPLPLSLCRCSIAGPELCVHAPLGSLGAEGRQSTTLGGFVYTPQRTIVIKAPTRPGLIVHCSQHQAPSIHHASHTFTCRCTCQPYINQERVSLRVPHRVLPAT